MELFRLEFPVVFDVAIPVALWTGPLLLNHSLIGVIHLARLKTMESLKQLYSLAMDASFSSTSE